MDKTFSEFLSEQLKVKNISQAELARMSGLTRQAISNYINDPRRIPDHDSLINISRALKLPPEEIFRYAGILPPQIEKDALTQQAEWLLSQLSMEKRQQAINFIQFLAEQQEKEEQKGAINVTRPMEQSE